MEVVKMSVPKVLNRMEELDKLISDFTKIGDYAFNHGDFLQEISEGLSMSPMMVIAEGRRSLEREKARYQEALEETEVVLSGGN